MSLVSFGSSNNPSWSEMIRLEPRLSELAQRAWRVSADDWRSYIALKRLLQLLVGWNCEKPELRSDEAFDAAHGVVFRQFRGGCRR
jgi:hypothetical protein